MLIKELKLHNIRSYIDETLQFPSGSVLLSGDIGSGKSSILLAIEFALFGADTSKISGNGLLRKGTTEGYIEMTMEIDSKVVTIRRGLKKSRNTIAQTAGTIIIDGIKKEAMPVELRSDIISLLGYPDDLATKRRNTIYRYTVYCPQEEMKAILVDEQESRIDTLRKMFGIDKYKRIRENCLAIVREIKNKQELLEEQTKTLDSKKAQHEDQTTKKKDIEQKLQQLLPLIAQLQDQLAATKDALAQADADVKALAELRSKLALAEAQAKAKSDALQQHTLKIITLQKKQSELITAIITTNLAELQSQISTLENKLQQATKQKITFEQRLLATRSNIIDIEKELSQTKALDIEEKRSLLQQLTQEIAAKDTIKKTKEALEHELTTIKETIHEHEIIKKQAENVKLRILEYAECPTCLQEVTKEHKEHVREREQDKIDDCIKHLAHHKEDIVAKEAMLQQLTQQLDAIREKEKQHYALTQRK